jgi:hypothetical protein
LRRSCSHFGPIHSIGFARSPAAARRTGDNRGPRGQWPSCAPELARGRPCLAPSPRSRTAARRSSGLLAVDRVCHAGCAAHCSAASLAKTGCWIEAAHRTQVRRHRVSEQAVAMAARPRRVRH